MDVRRGIWFAIAFSTVIYAVIAYAVAPDPQRPFAESVRQPVTLVLYLVAVSTFVSALVVRSTRRMEALPGMVVGLALFEACAVLGLVAALVQHDWRLFLPGWFLALIGFAREW